MLINILSKKNNRYLFMCVCDTNLTAFIKGEGIKIISYNFKVLMTIATMSSLGTLLATTEEFLLVATFSFRWCYSESIVASLINFHVLF